MKRIWDFQIIFVENLWICWLKRPIMHALKQTMDLIMNRPLSTVEGNMLYFWERVLLQGHIWAEIKIHTMYPWHADIISSLCILQAYPVPLWDLLYEIQSELFCCSIMHCVNMTIKQARFTLIKIPNLNLILEVSRCIYHLKTEKKPA